MVRFISKSAEGVDVDQPEDQLWEDKTNKQNMTSDMSIEALPSLSMVRFISEVAVAIATISGYELLC